MSEFEEQQQQQQQQKESFDHLPINERLKHKSYDARKHGVEELIKKFKEETNFNGGAFSQFEDYLSALVGDKNVLVAEKSLEALKLWVENYTKFASTSKDIIPVLVEKSLGAPKTKKAAVEILLLFIEYEVIEPVINELVKGFEHKTPKIRQTSVEVINEAVTAFGLPTIPIKNLIQPLMKLFDDKNAPVRKEVTNLTVELYKWIRDGIKPHISNLRPAQLKDLEKSFEEINERPTPTRFLKSYVPPTVVESEETAEDEVVEDVPAIEIDLPATEILSKIKREWFEKMMDGVDPNYKGEKDKEPKPFMVRQDALKELNEKLVNVEKLESGDYSNLVNHVLKTCSEPQVLVAQSALEAIDHLARGLKSEFTSYVGNVIPVVVSKYKEKRAQILKLIHSILTTIDVHCKPFTEFLDALSEGLKNKAPNMREQILIFIEECLKKNSKEYQKQIKNLVPLIYEQFENANPAVRNMATKVFSRLMFGYEKDVKPYFNKLDAQKQKKITEEVQILEKEAPTKAPVNQKKRTATVMEEVAPKEVVQKKQKIQTETPSTTRPKVVKVVTKKQSGAVVKKNVDRDNVPLNPRYTPEDAVEKYEALVSSEIRTSFNEKKWEVRCQALEDLCTFIVKLQSEKKLDSNAELLIHMLQSKPGWKEANVNILVKMISTLTKIVECTDQLSGFVAVSIMDFVLLKFATAKLKDSLKECLMAISCSISPQFVFNELMKRLKDIKSPTTIIEVFSWISEAIDDFGINLFNTKVIIDQMKSYIDNTNVKIKKACISIICTIKKYAGDSILSYFNDIKPALLSLLNDECSKVEMVSKFTAKRKVKGAEDQAEDVVTASNSDDRVDINAQISEHVKNLESNQWKSRADGIEAIEKIVDSTGGQMTSNIGGLIQNLKKRLDTEVNLKITASTIQLIGKIATAVGPNIQKFSPILLPSLIPQVVSNKPDVRKYALEAVESWTKAAGSFSLKYFSHVLLQDKGALEGKKEILVFIGDQIDNLQIKESEYVDIKPIINSLESSSNDVKKSAESVIMKLIPIIGLSQMKYVAKDAKSTVSQQLSVIFKKGAELKQETVEMSTQVEEEMQIESEPINPVVEVYELLPNTEKPNREKNQIGNPWVLEDSIREDLYHLAAQEAQSTFSPSLHKLLFSTNSTDVSTGISKLKELFKSKETIDCLDVILKYISIQLFDSKLSIKEKSLAAVFELFQQIKTQKYSLSDYESKIILPSLLELMGHHVKTIREKTMSIAELSIDISSHVAYHLLYSLSNTTNSLTRFNNLNQILTFLNNKSLDIFTIVQNELFNRILVCLDDSEKIKTCLSRILKIMYSIIGNQIFSYLHVTNLQKEQIEECVRNVKMIQKNEKIEVDSQPIMMAPTPTIVPKENKMTHLKLVKYSELDDVYKSPVERDSFMVLVRSINPTVTTEDDVENEIVTLKKLIAVFQSKDNSVIIHLKEIVVRMSVYFSVLIESDAVNFRFCKYLLSTLLVLFGNRQFVELMAIEDLQRLVHININAIVNHDESILKVQDGNQLIKGMNTLIANIMENSDDTYVFSAMIKLLLHTTEQEIKGKYVELLIKCILKLTKDFSTTISKIDIDIILLEFHEFLTLYPPTVLREKSDLALRTIKTTLNEIVKLKGPSIRTHLSLIPTHKNPVIVTYIEMMLKTNPKVATPQKSVRKSKIPSRTQIVGQDQELDDIFIAIQNPDTTSSGIYRLYKFIGDHPNVDYKSSHLSKCSQVFQDYILRQLEKTKNLEMEANNKTFAEKKSPMSSRKKLTTIDNSEMSKVKSPSKFDQIRRSTISSSFTNESLNLTATTDLASIKSRLMALGDEKENLEK